MKSTIPALLLAACLMPTAQASLIIPSSKIASGTLLGNTIMVINSPHVSELPLNTTTVPQGPDWLDDSSDGWRMIAAGVDAGTQGTSPWEADGSATEGQLRFYASGIGVTYTFNLADAGIALPDGAIIKGIYGTWTTRGVSGATYSYAEEGGQTGSFARTHTTAPAVNLAVNWIDSGSTTRTANFERLFSSDITVGGGNGFTFRVAKSGNTHQTDAILLDVYMVPEPSTALLMPIGLLVLLRRRR